MVEIKKKNDFVRDREVEQSMADSKQMEADIIYIAMMSDIDLDDGEEE